jgi:hypothetical protein
MLLHFFKPVDQVIYAHICNIYSITYLYIIQVPVFWSQSPYSLHPVPTLERTEQENMQAFQKHFKTQEDLYGKQIVVNLTELVGREAIVGAQYRRHIEELGDPNIK